MIQVYCMVNFEMSFYFETKEQSRIINRDFWFWLNNLPLKTKLKIVQNGMPFVWLFPEVGRSASSEKEMRVLTAIMRNLKSRRYLDQIYNFLISWLVISITNKMKFEIQVETKVPLLWVIRSDRQC